MNKVNLSYRDACTGLDVTYTKIYDNLGDSYSLLFYKRDEYREICITRKELLELYASLDKIYPTNKPHIRWYDLDTISFYKETLGVTESERIFISRDKTMEYMFYRSELLDIVLDVAD